MTDQKNTIVAIVLSALVLIGWQLYFGLPQIEKQKQIQQQQQQQTQERPAQPSSPGQTGAPAQAPAAPAQTPAQAPAQPAGAAQTLTREAALAGSPRVPIETPSLSGSIALKGGRIDDLSLTKYRETVDPRSPPIVLLAPSGSPAPFYSEFGWVPAAGTTVKVPGPDTLWRQGGGGTLSVGRPVTLVYDNGEGLEFRRTIAVDENYLFTIRDEVANKGSAAVTLYPFALISRHGTPPTLGYYILHEGPVGVLDDKLQEMSYADLEKKKDIPFTSTNAWLGFTDKYWAATLLPLPTAKIQAQFSAFQNGIKRYQTYYNLDPQTVAPGATASADTRLFAGAKEVSIVDGYNTGLGLNKFDLLIDWGWFYFITKPMFFALDWIYHRVGNFGVAILILTVLIKILFFPLANKSYAAMAKMKAVQPEMMAIRERFADDKMKQQQAMMELYKKEKVNPVAGCLPMLVQIPVFFALYKVLFVTIDLRHAPFFGWIKDLSAPDPLTVFNLFGLIPWDPTVVPVIGPFLHLGPWPLIMGVTMWFQMKLNPPPPDPAQKMIFDYMPIIFTFMLASFSAGLVIYWAWNNTLSVIQQSVIMHKHGAKIELNDNIKALFVKNKKA
jgi:YidC/Oxa1 family membrane protein insertase